MDLNHGTFGPLADATDIFHPDYMHRLDNLKVGKEPFTNNDKLVIPPLTTDIRFSDQLPTFQDESTPKDHKYYHKTSDGVVHFADQKVNAAPAGSPSHPRGKLHYHDHEHKNFSWTIPSTHDDAKTLRKKKLIGPVQNQHLCGSCWAQAVASAFSDCLVVGEVVQWSPHVSPTFCMSRYPQNMCGGGAPAKLALDLEKHGAADQSCVDQSWCDLNQACSTTNSANHFKRLNVTQLSSMIPKGGCYQAGHKLYYYLDKGTDMFAVKDQLNINDFRRLVKYHILDFGPVIGGYVVLRNFTSGAFTKVNKGIYFDRADYSSASPGSKLTFSDTFTDPDQVVGLHAVVIVGWGVADGVQYDNNKVGDVPFWYVRNSWGTRWGSQGYFKIAMYPYNRVAQFDKVVKVNLSNGTTAQLGGLILIRATQPVKVKKLNKAQTTTQVGSQGFLKNVGSEPYLERPPFYNVDGPRALRATKKQMTPYQQVVMSTYEESPCTLL